MKITAVCLFQHVTHLKLSFQERSSAHIKYISIFPASKRHCKYAYVCRQTSTIRQVKIFHVGERCQIHRVMAYCSQWFS